jgi:hypothetical protein
MSKFLLTVCAFGLLLSSAFAEEKSPEQHREESNQIRLQKIDWGTRIVASGTNQRIGFFYAVNPDCSASGDINIRVTKQPEHGQWRNAGITHHGNLFFFGLIPAVGFYAGGHILGQLLVFGVELCDMIMARCFRYAVRLVNDLLSWAGTHVSNWLTEVARTKRSQRN